MKSLTIGITNLNPSWKIILDQISPPYNKVNDFSLNHLNEYSCLIIPSNFELNKKNEILDYTYQGGGLILESKMAKKLYNISNKDLFVKYIDTLNDKIFSKVTPGIIDHKLNVPIKANYLKDQYKRYLIKTISIGKGYVIIIPSGLIDCIKSIENKRKNFPSENNFFPTERVSKVSKRSIREIIYFSLLKIHDKKKLPLITLNNFPKNNKTIFNFRIDTDFAKKSDIKTLYALCKKHKINATWFIETKSSEKWINIYRDMENQEISLHCHRHKVFNNFRKNNINLSKGISILNKIGVKKLGFASPFGIWNNELNKSIKKFDFKYSSEFGLDYDNLPFFPYTNQNSFSTVLQIPIHPICVGSLKNSRHSFDNIKKYFHNVILNHSLNNLPIFIYDHPKQYDEKVLTWLFNKINELDLLSITLFDYSKWWGMKSKIKWKAKIENNKIILDFKNWDDSVFLKFSKINMKSIIIDKKENINLTNFKWESQDQVLSFNDLEKLNQLNRKIIINNFLQFYWKSKL